MKTLRWGGGRVRMGFGVQYLVLHKVQVSLACFPDYDAVGVSPVLVRGQGYRTWGTEMSPFHPHAQLRLGGEG